MPSAYSSPARVSAVEPGQRRFAGAGLAAQDGQVVALDAQVEAGQVEPAMLEPGRLHVLAEALEELLLADLGSYRPTLDKGGAGRRAEAVLVGVPPLGGLALWKTA